MPTADRTVFACSGEITPPSPEIVSPGVEGEGKILIIGGGPAGLALGFELKRHGLPFLILEQGATVGESWRKMPRALKLASPWKSNSLPGPAEHLFPRHHQVSREEFLTYLQDYAHQAALPVQTEVTVNVVEKLADGLFRVQTSRGDFFSRVVVNATGYFSNPSVPDVPGARETSIPQLHVAHYRDPQNVRSILGKPGGLILIVGKRLSAGQIMVELEEAGFTVALSHRSPIRFGAGPLAWWFFFRIFPWLEWLQLKTNGDRASGPEVRMPGGFARRLLESGRVKTFPPIQRFETDAVDFENGESLRPDLVLYAIGFRPALHHLSTLALTICRETGRPELRDLESESVPGLYFLGLDHARNFQSRFLRGIRKDATFLAERLAQKFSGTKRQSQPQRTIPEP